MARGNFLEIISSREIKSAHPKGNQPWILMGRTDAEAPTLCHLMWRADSLEKTLMLGKIEGRRRRGQQRMRWLDCITDSIDVSLGQLRGVGDGQGGLACCSQWGLKESDWLDDWIAATNLVEHRFDNIFQNSFSRTQWDYSGIFTGYHMVWLMS